MADVKLFNLGMNNFTSTGNVTLCVSRVRLPLPCFFAGADRSLRSGIPGIPGIQGIAGGIAGAPLSFLFGQVALKLILLGSTWP